MTRNLEKKMVAVDCGAANTCFQVLFLNSICGMRLQIRMMYMGNKKTLSACQPHIKCTFHGACFNWLIEPSGLKKYTRKNSVGIKPAPSTVSHTEAVRLVFNTSARVAITKLIR